MANFFFGVASVPEACEGQRPWFIKPAVPRLVTPQPQLKFVESAFCVLLMICVALCVCNSSPVPPYFWATVSKTVHRLRPMLSDRCLSCLYVGLTLVCYGQTVGRIIMKLGVEVGLGPGRIVLDGDPASSKKGTQPPIFGPCLLRPNGHPSQLLLNSCVLTSCNLHCHTVKGMYELYVLSERHRRQLGAQRRQNYRLHQRSVSHHHCCIRSLCIMSCIGLYTYTCRRCSHYYSKIC